MSVQHTNRKGKIYSLYEGKTKKGNTQFYFAIASEGILVENLPEGYEIYENPNGQVFLRKKILQMITPLEKLVVEEELKNHSHIKFPKVDLKKNEIIVYLPPNELLNLEDSFSKLMFGINPLFFKEKQDERLQKLISYCPEMKFQLIDKEQRIFQAFRFCYKGSVDDWIEIGESDKLGKLVKKYIKHLNKESFYELHF